MCTSIWISPTSVAVIDTISVVVLLLLREPVESLPEEHVENVVGRGVVLEEHKIAAAVISPAPLLTCKLWIVTDRLVVFPTGVVIGPFLGVR